MIRDTENRHAGDIPAATDGTAVTATGAFDSCKAGALLLTRRSGVFAAQSPYSGSQNVVNSQNIMYN
jgi:(2Fe-2S) ferredoxin